MRAVEQRIWIRRCQVLLMAMLLLLGRLRAPPLFVRMTGRAASVLGCVGSTAAMATADEQTGAANLRVIAFAVRCWRVYLRGSFLSSADRV